MNVRPSFVPHAQSPELMKPRDRALDDPTIHTQAAAVLGVALGQDGSDATAAQRLAMRLRIVRSIALHPFGPPLATPSAFAPQRRNRVDQGK